MSWNELRKSRLSCTASGDSNVETTGRPYDALAGKEVYLVSKQELVDVTKLWGDNERCVLIFTRSMG